MEWPNKHHFFGKFRSQAEAEKWIAEHRWLTEQRTNIIIADDLPSVDSPSIDPPGDPLRSGRATRRSAAPQRRA